MARHQVDLPDLIRYPRWGAEVGTRNTYNSHPAGKTPLSQTHPASTTPMWFRAPAHVFPSTFTVFPSEAEGPETAVCQSRRSPPDPYSCSAAGRAITGVTLRTEGAALPRAHQSPLSLDLTAQRGRPLQVPRLRSGKHSLCEWPGPPPNRLAGEGRYPRWGLEVPRLAYLPSNRARACATDPAGPTLHRRKLAKIQRKLMGNRP